MLTRVIAVLTGGVLALGLLGAPGASNAAEAHRHKKKKPTVTYTLAAADLDQRTQGAAVTFKVKRLPKGGSVVLQSNSPYDGGWADLAVGTTKTGTLQAAPWPLLGEYAVRVVVRDAKGKQVARAGRSTVRAFGIIPLEQFASASVIGTATIGGQTFPYGTRLHDGRIFDFRRTSCTAISITLGSDSADFRVAVPGKAAVLVPAQTLQTFDAFATPGYAYYYTVYATTAGAQVYANGSAYCYTRYGTTDR